MTTDKKKYNEGRKALQVFLDEDTHTKFKMLCAMRGVKMTDVIADKVDEWIRREERNLPAWGRNPHTGDKE